MRQSLMFIFLGISQLIFSQGYAFEYDNEYELKGTVQLVKYQLHSEIWKEAYILKLDSNISIQGNDELKDIEEIHINIVNSEIEKYEGQMVSVKGILFHALNIHHRRDVCIFVKKVIE